MPPRRRGRREAAARVNAVGRIKRSAIRRERSSGAMRFAYCALRALEMAARFAWPALPLVGLSCGKGAKAEPDILVMQGRIRLAIPATLSLHLRSSTK